jgi:hypothetical protein
VELRLDQTDGTVTVEVYDNGKAFDTTSSFPGHWDSTPCRNASKV